MKPIFALALLLAAPAFADAEANKQLAARVFEDLYNKRDFAAATQIYAPDFINHGVTHDASLAEDLAATRTWCAAFPDLHMTIQQEIAEGDRVTVLWLAEAMGNGHPMKLRGITIWRVKAGRLSEEWSEFDEATARAAITATNR
jgi:predicted SnoaL-like aldol condensation-catalyzing enzyme